MSAGIAALLAAALVLGACGRYGPPRRSAGPPQAEAEAPAPQDADEEERGEP